MKHHFEIRSADWLKALFDRWSHARTEILTSSFLSSSPSTGHVGCSLLKNKAPTFNRTDYYIQTAVIIQMPSIKVYNF